jgi:DNA repair protein RadD
MGFTLRPQQEVFEDAIRGAFRRNRSVLAVAATGFGKGHVAGDMAFKAVTEKGRRPLLVTDRRQIVLQLTGHCQKFGVGVGVVMGSIEPDPDAPVQVASAQTLQRRGTAAVCRQNFVILDEAHKSYQFYKKLITEHFPTVPVLGFTATPVGPGGAKLGHFDTVVEPIKNSEVIATGDLLPVRYIAPSEPDMGGIDLKRASADDVGKRVDACTIYGDVFGQWEPYKHMQTMVVLPSRAVCNGFLQECLRRGYTARVVDGTTAQDERDETFSEFKAEGCQFLLGVDVIREGLDLPIAQCLIDLQPTHQFRVYWQKIGRIKRPHEGQDYAVTLDFAGNIWRHMVHPDQDPPWEDVTSDTTIEAAVEKKSGIRCPECGSKEVFSVKDFGYKCEDCGATWQPKHNWVCPHCKAVLGPNQKLIGGVCPNCHEKVTSKPVRRIRMEDGSMRTVPAHEIKRRKKSKADSEQATWTKFVYIANGWNRKNPGKPQKKLAWCREMFNKETGHYPRGGLKYMPDSVQSGDWRRTPDDLFPWMNKRKRETGIDTGHRVG